MQNRILIIGGGTGGISVAARLQHELGKDAAITIVEPQSHHYYQPLWTLVGAGVFSFEESQKQEADLIPSGVIWVKNKVSSFDPQNNQVLLEDGTSLVYDSLIVAAGIQLDWDKIKGAKEALETPYVCSNYLPGGATKTWELYQKTEKGNAVFTQPPLPIKCAGAPQKAMYLADDYFRKEGKRKNINVIFAAQGPRIFGVDKYRISLEKILKRKEVDTKFEHNLVEVKAESKTAVFKRPDGTEVEVPYEMLHIVPPQSAPDFIKKSELADAQGWVEVDKFTLQHVRYPNVFSLGDCSSLPTSRTGAAIRKEAPVLVANLIAYIQGKPLEAKYDGYSSCPIVTGYGKVILAEFDYDGNTAETFPFDQSKERWSMWMLKAHLIPKLYWYAMLKGKA